MFLPGKLLLLSRPLLGEALFGFNGALFTLQAQGIAEWRLKILEELPRENADALDLDGFYGNPPESRHVGHFVLELEDDAAAFAQGILDSHARDLMPDGRFHDILQSPADCAQGSLSFRKIKICRRFAGIGDAPDGKAGDSTP